MDQSTKAPTRKVSAAGAAGATVTLIVVLLSAYGVVLPPEAVAALVTLASFASGYLVRET